MNQHASYVSFIRKSLKSKGITPKELCAYLLYLPAFNPHAERSKGTLLFDIRKKLEEATTIDDIFIALNEVCVFHDCDIFQSIVKEHCLDQSQEELKYPEYLKVYMESHKVSEFIHINPSLKKFSGVENLLAIKFDIKSTCKLDELDKLKLSVAKILGLEKAALRLLDLDEGCVTATYLISPSIAGVIFTRNMKFTAEEVEQFQAVPVLWLKYDNCTFDFRRINSHANREKVVDMANAGELVEMVEMSMLLTFYY